MISNGLEDKEFICKIQKHSVYGNMAKMLYIDKFPLFKISKDSIRKYKDYLMKCYFRMKFLKWDPEEKNPEAEIIASVGEYGDVTLEAECLIHQFKVPAEPYPEEVTQKIKERFDLQEPNFTLRIPSDERAKRMDLSNLIICTIDPETARDLDDALSIEDLGDGTYKVGVHIADVSHFVELGSFLDIEASKRSTSFYFPHTVYCMLPEILSNNLCSLNANEEKYAFSIFFFMDNKGNLLRDKEPILTKSIIISCAKLSYGCAQDVIEGKITNNDNWPHEKFPICNNVHADDLIKKIKLLHQVAMKRRGLRRSQNSTFFNFGEKKRFVMSKEKKQPIDWYYEPIKEANNVVEEYMLMANLITGEIMVKNFRKYAILRNHPQMTIDKSNMTTYALKKVGNIE